jgi:uncharacterized OsmC-like protein
MAEEPRFSMTMEHLKDFEFKVKFDWEDADELLLDEPDPLGGEKGPNASRLIGAATGNCLSASLLFCLRKSRVDVTGIKTVIRGRMERNEDKRMRIGGIEVSIELDTPAEKAKLDRCLNLFEDYCVVTQSVREGIPVSVEVVAPDGTRLTAG